MRTLHVAALPFPTAQGTQAAVLAYVRAGADAGDRVALLTYAAGDSRTVLPESVQHTRSRSWLANDSLRSGPSVAKIVEDASLVASIRRERHGSHVVAHHIEAALACVLAGVPFDWLVHTALGPELPLYGGPSWAAPFIQRMGDELDALVARRARRVLTVSPLLADRLRVRTGVGATYVPIPWVLEPEVTPALRHAARTEIGIEAAARVVLYAGNLDAYQGIDTLLRALERPFSRALTLLIATESEPSALLAALRARCPAVPTRVVPLATDAQRHRAHHAADVAVVPRRLRAGFSVKILEAFAHGLPVICVEAASGGVDLSRTCRVVRDDPNDLRDALESVLDGRSVQAELGRRGREHLTMHHAPARVHAQLRSSQHV